MDPTVHAIVVGAAVFAVVVLGLLNLIETRRTRRMVEALFGPKRGQGLLAETMFAQRGPVVVIGTPRTGSPAAPAVDSSRAGSTLDAPGSSRPPSVAPAAGAPVSSGGPQSAGAQPMGEPLKPPALAPMPGDAPEAKRPPPRATEPASGSPAPAGPPEPSSRAERSLVRPPAPEPAPDVGRSAPEAAARDLGASDQAQADQAPSRPPPSAAAPPASGLAPTPDVGGSSGHGRETRSERPAPHKPPVKSGRPPSLFDGLREARLGRAAIDSAPGEHAASAPAPGAPEIPAATPEDFDGDDEPTRVAPHPLRRAAEAAPVVQGPPRIRATYGTLVSTQAADAPSTRPKPSVDVIDTGALGATPARGRT